MMTEEAHPDRPAVPGGVRWAVWLGGLAAYTYLLLVPEEWLPPWLRSRVTVSLSGGFTVGKLGHSLGHGVLAALIFWLPLRGPGRWACLAVLSLHAFVTEYIQTFVPGRHGQWIDVGIDHVGLAWGTLLGGLCDWCGRALRAGGGGRERVAAAQQADGHPGREDADADPL